MALIEKINSREFTHKEILDLLRQWRENNERRSNEIKSIVCYYNPYDVKNINERLMIYEQLIFTALDCHCYESATFDISELSKIFFPGSIRVMRLKAMLLEAQEKYDEALDILDRIISADETNAPARKRRVAVLKAQGLIPEAIKELVDYLKKFMSDVEAWQQLCELYLAAGEAARAAFCAEELLLHQPHHHLHHQRLADIRYTMGGVENLELAKSYYCQALKLNPDNMRATLGLFLTTSSLLQQYKSSGSSKRKESWRLHQWAHARAAARTAHNDTALTSAMLNLAISE